MAKWCIHTGRSVADYLTMSGYEREAFTKVANTYRTRKGSMGTL